MSELDARSILEGNELFLEFKGSLTEQYVLQQLVAETAYTPYYFRCLLIPRSILWCRKKAVGVRWK